jgi:hypothetical protein
MVSSVGSAKEDLYHTFRATDGRPS